MIKAKTYFEFYCPHCGKTLKIEVHFKSDSITITNREIFWEGACPNCDEWVYKVKL
jgi:predicted RNA-binding Zn-ribbon protein involved in translation (DUF1610 family)